MKSPCLYALYSICETKFKKKKQQIIFCETFLKGNETNKQTNHFFFSQLMSNSYLSRKYVRKFRWKRFVKK